MDSTARIISPINSEFDQFKTLLYDALHMSSEPLLEQIFSFVSDHPGKLMRPILVILFSKLYGSVNEKSYSAAIALEMLHSASLMHDDVVDESLLRRGMPSVNATFGNKVAVLSGDFLLSQALFYSRKTDDLRIFDLIIQLGLTLSEGEIIQIENLSKSDFVFDTYFDVITKKTASLFIACCKCGAYCAKANDSQIEAANQFGLYLGQAFQIVDDILDYGYGVELGKPTFNDMKEGKLTLPLLYALSLKDAPDYSKATELALKVRNLQASYEDIQWLAQYASKMGGIDYAYSKAGELKSKAMELIPVESGGVGDALSLYFDYVLNRRK